jgi:uridine kinase
MLIISIAGPYGSGTKLLAKAISISFRSNHVYILSQDNFRYRNLNSEYNGTEKEVDIPRMRFVIHKFQKMDPPYRIKKNDYWSNAEIEDVVERRPDLIIMEGTLVLHFPELLVLSNFNIYINTSLTKCLLKELTKAETKKNYNALELCNLYISHRKPLIEHFIIPSMKNADIILPGIERKIYIAGIIRHLAT